MIAFSLSINEDVADALKKGRKGISSGMRSIVKALLESAQATAPVRSGRLKRSIKSKHSGLQGTVTYATKYASYLDEGTGLYGPRGQMIVIRPKNKKALFWRGARHPVKLVRQRGIKPRRLAQRAIQKADLESAFESGFSSGSK